MTRRRFLQGTALAGVGAFLAACTGGADRRRRPVGRDRTHRSRSPSRRRPPRPPVRRAAPTPKTVTGPLKFANWPAYIDLAGKAGDAGEYAPGSSPTLEEFKKKYSIDVDYEEKIERQRRRSSPTIQPAARRRRADRLGPRSS